MTEKRFTINMESECIDDAKEEIFIDFNDKIDFYELCEFLNKLSCENKQLKQDVDYFNKTYEVQERGLNIVPAMCTISSPTPSRRELFEENEKLKQELKDCHKSNHEYYVDKDKLIRLCEEHNIDWTKVIK